MVGITLAERITCKRSTIYDSDNLELLLSMTAKAQQSWAGPKAYWGNNITFGKMITERIYGQKTKKG